MMNKRGEQLMLKNKKKQPLLVKQTEYYWDNIYWHIRGQIMDLNDEIKRATEELNNLKNNQFYQLMIKENFDMYQLYLVDVRFHNNTIRENREKILKLNDDFIAEKMYDDLDDRTITYYDE